MEAVATQEHKGSQLYLIQSCKQEPGHHAAFVPCSACQLAGFNKERRQFENCVGVVVKDPEKG